jgi:hypothetical protein
MRPKHRETIEWGLMDYKKDAREKKEMWRITRMIIRRQKK